MDTPQPRPRRRRPWPAATANLFFPPLGHVYAGRAARGILLLAGLTAISILAIWVAARSVDLTRLLLAILLEIAGVLWLMTDAAVVARRQSGAPLCWYQRWYVYLPAAVLSYGCKPAAVSVARQYLATSYYMSSGVMQPTLAIRDYFLVDRLTYRWKQPERYDVLV